MEAKNDCLCCGLHPVVEGKWTCTLCDNCFYNHSGTYWTRSYNCPRHPSKTKSFVDLAITVAELVEVKNKAYGNSFSKCKEFLKLLYPDGVPTEKYSDMLTVVRVFDKLMRIATDKDALGESPWQDIMGYALLALKEKDIKS